MERRKMDNVLKDFKQALHFAFILSMITFLVRDGKSEKLDEHCYEENNTTWICNYVPKTVLEHFTHIGIVDFKRKDESVMLNSSSFSDESWSSVQTLMFSDTRGRDLVCIFSHACFNGLEQLKELRIHMSYFWFDSGVFIGLPSVHTLDMSRCYRLVLDEFIEQFKAAKALPNLKRLFLSEVGSYDDARNNINLAFVEALSPRNITHLDISKTQIAIFNVTSVVKVLKSIEYVNASYSIIANTWVANITQEDIQHIKVVDLSHTTLPAKIVPSFPFKFVVTNQTLKYSGLKMPGRVKTLFTPLVINVTGINRYNASEWIYNSTVILDEKLHWKVKTLIAKKNNIRYLDVVVRCPTFKLTSLVQLDLSDNGLQVIRPITCIPNLEKFDLSKNNLRKMLEQKSDLFEELFTAYTKLRVINLSQNQLPHVPRTLFKNNKNIEIIDLSSNKLEQLHLDLRSLYLIHVFDVSNNNIKVLDAVSINNLNGIPCAKALMFGQTQCSVVFTSNPIKCSTCESKIFIEWLLNAKNVHIRAQGLTCTSEDGTNLNFDVSVLRKVQNICNRRTIVVVSIVSTVVTLLTISVVVLFLYRRKRRIQKKQNRENVINKLIEGEGKYEFVAFLSYCSRDDQFVQENVIDRLNENLQLMTGIDRNLVCTGDQHLRPGFMVHDETIRCLDRASVIIIVVSNNFCRSLYCQHEFDQAYMQKKPIVLMLMEHVEEDLMMPALKQLYKRDVRILWTVENGQYLLKSTWENVCRSVLDKIQA